jgi:hypothetical protein
MRKELAISPPCCQQTSLCKDKRQKSKKKKKYIGQFCASFTADTKQTTEGRGPHCITPYCRHGCLQVLGLHAMAVANVSRTSRRNFLSSINATVEIPDVSGRCIETPNENKQMKKVILIIGLLGLLLLAGPYAKRKYFDPKQRKEKAKNEVASLETNNELRNGDLIFQTSLSRQSKAIQVSTKSKYSHCGLVFRKENDTINWFVLEADQLVKWTPLEKWITRGKDGKFVIKRLQSDPMLLELRATA